MGTNIGGNGQFHNKHRGGIFLSVLLFFSLTTSLLLLILEDEQLTSDFTIRTTNLYYAKTIKELFLMEYYQLPDESKPITETSNDPVTTADEFPAAGERFYNKGKLTYQIKDKKVELTIKVGEAYYSFEEKAREK